MIKEQLEQELLESGKVEFKLYSLEYTIELSNEQYVIYANFYKEKKITYKSLQELLNNYMIYNESIMDNINKVIILDAGDKYDK